MSSLLLLFVNVDQFWLRPISLEKILLRQMTITTNTITPCKAFITSMTYQNCGITSGYLAESISNSQVNQILANRTNRRNCQHPFCICVDGHAFKLRAIM